jgi:hypothetical protein
MLQTHVDKHKLMYDNIIGIKPTGWTTPRSTHGSKHYSIESSSANITIYGMILSKHGYDMYNGCSLCLGFPYSEHSSFDELRTFIQYLKPKRIIPTSVDSIKHNNICNKYDDIYRYLSFF